MQENTNSIPGASIDASFSSVRDAAAHAMFKESGEFFKWIVRKRHSTEHQIWLTRRSLREGLLYAERALTSVSVASLDHGSRGTHAATFVVSPVVVNFATDAARLLGHEIFLAQLDVLYQTCYGQEGDDLNFEDRDAATVQFLWDKFHAERDARELDEADEETK